MKLPINLGNKLFFRVIAPGAVLAPALVRLTQTVLQYYGIKIPIVYALPIEIVVFGSFFLILDMPIYMLFEGRRFWPSPLLEWGRRKERARLLSLHRIMRRYDVTRIHRNLSRIAIVEANRRYLEAAVDLSNFPLSTVTIMPSVVWPTRLGNLIAAYEQYPRLKYGLDAVFYWPRLWVVIEKDLREEIDNQQAQADGILYISAALIFSAIVLIIYAIADMTMLRYLCIQKNQPVKL